LSITESLIGQKLKDLSSSVCKIILTIVYYFEIVLKLFYAKSYFLCCVAVLIHNWMLWSVKVFYFSTVSYNYFVL